MSICSSVHIAWRWIEVVVEKNLSMSLATIAFELVCYDRVSVRNSML